MSYSRNFGWSDNANFTPSTVVETDSSGDPTSSNISDTQLSYLSGLTGNVQTQINGCQPLISLSDSIVPVTTSSGALTSSSITTTELGYLSGVTSNIQTQLNDKQATITLSDSIVPVTTSSGALTSSTITSTELGYLSGVTSNIQTQISGCQTKFTGLSESGGVLTSTDDVTIQPATDGNALVITNHAGTQTVFEVNTGSSSTITMAPVSSTVVQPQTDNTTAFTVLNRTFGETVFNVDTSTPAVTLGASTTLTPANDGTIFNVETHGGTSLFSINSSTSALTSNSNSNVIKPGTDGTCFEVETHSGTNLLSVNSSTSTLTSNSNSNVIQPGTDGTCFEVKSNGGTNMLAVNSSSSAITSSANSMTIQPQTDGNAFVVNSEGGSNIFVVTTNGHITIYNPLQLQASILPIADAAYQCGWDTDRFTYVWTYAVDANGDTLSLNTTAGGQITIGGNIIPNANNTLTLGESGTIMSNVWSTHFSFNSSLYLEGSTDTIIIIGGGIAPGTDNTYSCGQVDLRWTYVYAVNGTIQTSDQSVKTSVVALGAKYGKAFINKLKPVSWKWTTGSDTQKTHMGLVASDIAEVIGGDDLHLYHPGQDVKGKKTLDGLCYTELIGPLVQAFQESDKELQEAKQEIVGLKSTVELLQSQLQSIQSQLLVLSSKK